MDGKYLFFSFHSRLPYGSTSTSGPQVWLAAIDMDLLKQDPSQDLGDDRRLTFRGEAPSAPYAYMGVHITRPDYADGGPDGPFSLSPLWRASAAAGRLYGCVLDGDWMHVGDPQARDEAEARLSI